ncbi:MAG: methylenetetrahydrofolate reductase [Actinomycetota bacterium]|jgi:methylenetetrahydrofolate reductase (NADPH)|nr:methylenetetrahydrofolate reductase [Actinomycetota bacterium]
MSLREALESGRFVVTSEVGPPKGIDVSEMMETAELLRGRVDALNVTDNQAAIMRLCTLAACLHLENAGFDSVLQVTCRDRNRLALQSDLLGAASLGITNVLALTGDHVTLGDHREAKPVFDLESVQLLEVIESLNGGVDAAGKELHGTPDFLAGAVVTPDANPLPPQLAKFAKKVKAGARFFQTQAVYDATSFKRFMEQARQFGVPVMAGVVVLRSAGMAKFMNRNIPGIVVPDAVISELEHSSDAQATGIKIASRFIDEVRDHCDGVHIMAVGAERLVPSILDAAGL